jgi:macrodomain Ter protein organizer (MatP/YcbG family)
MALRQKAEVTAAAKVQEAVRARRKIADKAEKQSTKKSAIRNAALQK